MMVIKQSESPTTAEYIAGLIDGGGSLNYLESVRKSGNIHYTPAIDIVNQNHLIKDFFGFVKGWKRHPIPEGEDYHARSFEEVATFLRGVIPHMTMKKQRAIDLLELCEMRIEELSQAYRKPYSAEFVEKVHAFRDGE